MSGVAELDEVQYDLEIDGEHVRRQIRRQIWERSGWATVAIVYEERAKTAPFDWSAPKVALLRFRKLHDVLAAAGGHRASGSKS